MVPLPNFTIYNPKTKEKTEKTLIGKLLAILYFLRNLYIPPHYKDLNDRDFSPLLQIEKNENEFFNIPSMGAAINSRWGQTMKYWIGPLSLYIVFLIIFSTLTQIHLSDGSYYAINHFMIYIFYYYGTYLLTIELMQMMKYKSKYFTIFNMLDLCSIILAIIVFTLILLVKVFATAGGINNEAIIILTSVATLILWIELVCLWFHGTYILIIRLIFISFFFKSSYGFDYFQ